ncbi:unnamed protein product [Rhizophagus irregularis]|nr:unnamed protein product [Rhizophagus irregularis]CAB5216334.1 unnamed protein product [Rhizophagus irregularis]
MVSTQWDTSVGSGSPFAYEIVDSGFDSDLSVQEAIELGTFKLPCRHRDSASGGSINKIRWMGIYRKL